MIEIRKCPAPSPLSRATFGERYRAKFVDPAFADEVRNVASSVMGAVKDLRAVRLSQPVRQIKSPRPE